MPYTLDGEWANSDGDLSKFVAVPASAVSTGKPGQMAYDADYIYMCIAVDTWKRTPLATW